MELLTPLEGPVPAPFVALTVKEYVLLGDKPVTVTGEEAPLPVNPPGEDVAV